MPIAHIEMAAGVHDILIDGVASTITVPAPAAGTIAEVSPTIGDTLTVTGSNETDVDPSLVTYLWEVDTGGGFGAAGGTNNAATYDTTGQPAGDYRRTMTIGDLSAVSTPGKTVAAGMTLTYVGSNTSKTGDGVATSFTYTAEPIGGAGEIFVVFQNAVRRVTSMTIGGTAATLYKSHDANSDVTLCIGHATVPSGTTATIVVNLEFAQPSGDIPRLSIYRVEGFSAVRDSAGSQVDAVASLSYTLDVAGGGAVIGAVGKYGGNLVTGYTGITVDAALFDVDNADEAAVGSATGLSANAAYAVGFDMNGASSDLSAIFLSIE